MSLMVHGDRRLEAESYLAAGFAIRSSLEGRAGWVRLSEAARVWMPGRLKGIHVHRDVGTPFLAATQIFDVQPIPR